MKAKSMILIAIALGCGLVASLGITNAMSGKGQAPAPKIETKKILTAMGDIDIGTALTEKNVRLEDWPKDKVPEGALTDVEQLDGQKAGARMYKGEALLEGKLLTNSNKLDRVPPGFRVIPVRVQADTVSKFILPGDRVDVSVIIRGGRISEKSLVKTILTNVRVFAVDSKVERSNDEDTSGAKTISVLVQPRQAETLNLAGELGKIRLMLRSPDDESEAVTGGVNESQLLTGLAETGSPEPPAETADDFDSFVSKMDSGERGQPVATVAAAPRHEMVVFTNEGMMKYRWDGEGGLPQQVNMGAGAAPAARAPLTAPVTLAPTTPHQGDSRSSGDKDADTTSNDGNDGDDLDALRDSLGLVPPTN